MLRTKGKTNFEDLPLEERKEIFEAIRDAALDEQQAKLKALGVEPKLIAKARTECIATNSDKPFFELFKTVIGLVKP